MKESRLMFSVCVPNYNYAGYIGETIMSVLNQHDVDLEVVVSDNASTDDSVKVVHEIIRSHSNVRLRVNRCNIGFFENLKRAASLAQGEWMTMLSSDDVAAPGAYSRYQKVIKLLGERASKTVLCSTADKIDSRSNKLSSGVIDWKLWQGAERIQELSDAVGADVWMISASQLLAQSLKKMRNPLHFATITYSKSLHDSIEGYSWGGIINPDKQFAWNLLGVAEHALIVDAPLFQYRWHDSNQSAQQTQSGALKLWVDQYVSTFMLPQKVLEKAGITRNEMAAAFIEEDIALRGFQCLAQGQRVQTRRLIHFGEACYPELAKKNIKLFALRILLLLGPLGAFLSSGLEKIFRKKYA